MSLFNELKRRNVFRVGIAYLVVAWLVVQVADVMIDNIGAPDWLFSSILLLLGIGFPVVLVFAWAFELTPEGIKRESEIDRSASIAPQTGRRLDRAIIGVLVIALAYFMLDKFALQSTRDVATTQQAELQPATELAAAPAPTREAPSTAADTRKSIVVLPFVNMSADPEQEYFSDGLSEELLNVLAKIEDLRVISRTSAFAFKGKDISIPEIAKQLDVAYVLEGSVRSAGNDMRITAQLVEVANDSHLWSEAYNRRMENIFEVQEEISQAIAQALQVRLVGAEGAGQRTENLEAYQLFLRGRHHYQARGEENMALAVETLEAAVRLDPAFDEAWANLAAARGVMSFYVEEGYAELYDRSAKAARQAIELNADNGLAHAVLGLLYYGDLDYERSFAELELALELNPNESNAYLWLGIALSSLGYAESALEVLQRAEPIDPVFANLHNWLTTQYLITGDFAKAREHLDRLQQLGAGAGINYPGELELTEGDLDAAEAAMLIDVDSYNGDEGIIRAVFAALRDPSRKAESIGIIQSLDTPANWAGIATDLMRIGAVAEAVDNWRALRASGRKLRSSNNAVAIWLPSNRARLSDPALHALFKESHMADYWRKHGDPDLCRRQPDDSFKCGDL